MLHMCVYVYTHIYIVFTKYCGKPLTFEVFNFLLFESVHWISSLVTHQTSYDLTHPPPASSLVNQIPHPLIVLNISKNYFLKHLQISKSMGIVMTASTSKVHKELALEPNSFY